jgi:thiamine biosynthesis lipoprotein
MSVIKEMFTRKRLLPLLLIVVIYLVWRSRQTEPLMAIEGQTFGSIAYHIKYKDADRRNFKVEIDSLLDDFNDALSHYRPASELSMFNRDSLFVFQSTYFRPVLQTSKKIFSVSGGSYNPAVMPLVNAWGFGPDESLEPDSATIDSLLTIIDFNKVQFNDSQVWKLDKRIQLDFSAIAKGFGVDVVARLLENEGIDNYFVEIGGEVLCRGTNNNGNPWRVGIIDPASNLLNQSFIATVDVKNRAVATSANNFNYVIRDGVKYSHTIDPKTGYPAHNSILSASVFARDCMTADALATAFMAAGVEEAQRMLGQLNNVEALLIYSEADGQVVSFITDGIKNDINFIEMD